MIAHYAQKISVGIALVCMVNHTAISQHQTSVDTPLTQMDIDCPRLKGSVQIVNKKIMLIHLFRVFFLEWSICLDEGYSRSYFRKLFLGIFNN